jgi:hypothetical protein
MMNKYKVTFYDEIEAENIDEAYDKIDKICEDWRDAPVALKVEEILYWEKTS